MKLFGLIGYPLSHSFSKRYFTDKFEVEGVDAKYELFELAQIDTIVEVIQENYLSGLNVTIPYKEKIIPFLDSLDETAQEIGAVNVVKFIREGGSLELRGYNTDAIGFANSIKPLLATHHKRALILGTGGASKAVEYALRNLGLDVTFVSRHPSENQFSYEDLDEEVMDDYTVIVNTTPLGTYPNVDTVAPIPFQFISKKHLFYDLVYNPAETLFLKKGKEQGAGIKNGEEMLTLQAEEAWKIW